MASSQTDASVPGTTTQPAKPKVKFPDDDFEWELDSDSEDDDERSILRTSWHEFQSAILIHVLDSGIPVKEKGLMYFVLIQLHEHLYPPLYVYSAIPSILMWYYPSLRPRHVFAITKLIDHWKQGDNSTTREYITLGAAQIVTSMIVKYTIDFQGTIELVEPLFGPIDRWTATLLPIVPGIFFRSIQERPNAINGFVPENRQGVVMAVFISACTAVLPRIVQWWIWAAYAIPSVEYPTMFVDFVICTFSWVYLDVTPMAGYAMWLLVNQYRHPKTWFRISGGGPSIVLKRQRRGTTCYIITIICIRLLQLGIGESLMENEDLVLRPQAWIPLAIVLIAGLYLLKYGVLLRVYRYEHKPLHTAKSFRLLRLRAQPCLPNTPIQCDMIHTSLFNPPQYDAISHRWDSSNSPKEFILIDGGLYQVSQSIHALLMAKRSNLHPRYLWIDSVCVDQSKVEEKSKQVGMMRNIFEEADMVLGWLDSQPSDAKKAVSLIRRINETTTDSAYRSLRMSSESGWEELGRLISNEWFERVWIIQELAVAKMCLLRYGDQYIAWPELPKALVRIMASEVRLQDVTMAIPDHRKMLNAMIMEEARAHIVSLDLIKSKDMLKLTLGFKATLPIDHVYAMLGLVDERHTPLFHPRFGMSDLNETNRVLDPRTGVKDIGKNLSLTTQILRALKGRSKNRRAKAIVAAGYPTAVRYISLLTRDLKIAMAKLDQMPTSFAELEEERMQVDYTSKSTAHLVYTYVAKDLVKQNDALSFLSYAGTAFERHHELQGLPSWVPDWSREVSTYVLPWHRYVESEAVADDAEEAPEPTIKLDGPRFLLVSGYRIGTVSHALRLTQDCDVKQLETWEGIRLDFEQLRSNFKAAYDVAEAELQTHHQDKEDFKHAFSSTLLVDPDNTNQSAISMMRDWTLGLSDACPIAIEAFFDRIGNHSSTALTARTDNHLPEATSKYADLRRRSSSVESKLVHLIRVDVIPSFSQYRSHKPSTNTKLMPSILDEADTGPLAAYAQYVDYTIGRSFIILDSKSMGLSPSATKVGDIVVEVRSKGRTVWLTLREEVSDEHTNGEREKAENGSQDESQPSKTYRLIGEAYVHNIRRDAPPANDPRWYKLS